MGLSTDRKNGDASRRDETSVVDPVCREIPGSRSTGFACAGRPVVYELLT